MKNNKKISSHRLLNVVSGVFLFVSAVVFITLSFTSQYQDLNDTYELAEETVDFLQNSCERYDQYALGVSAKSIQKVLDTSTGLREFVDSSKVMDSQFLDRFIRGEHIGGILVLDEKLQTVAQADMDEQDSGAMWEDIVSKETITDILDHPSKVYVDSAEIEGKVYEYAVVSGIEKKGLILCYNSTEKPQSDPYEYSVKNMLTNNNFHKNPTVVITENSRIISSNEDELNGVQTEKCKITDSSSIHWKDDQLTSFEYKSGLWYGLHRVCGNYSIYVAYPSDEVFYNRTNFIVIGFMVYLLICVVILAVQRRADKKNLHNMQKQFRIINAISTSYTSAILFHLDRGGAEAVKVSDNLKKVLEDDADPKNIIDYVCEKYVDGEYKESILDFMNLDTVRQRLKGVLYLGKEIRGLDHRWYSIVLIPQRYDDVGEIQAIIVAARDITDVKEKEHQYQEELKNSAEKERKANEAKTVFLRHMSHDVRTPINGILGMAEIAGKNLDDPEKTARCLEKIRNSSEYLLALANEALMVSKLEAGKTFSRDKTFDLKKLVQDAVELAATEAEKKHVDLVLKTFSRTHWKVTGRALDVRKIVQNIIGNAVKYTDAGGNVTVSCQEKGSCEKGRIFEFICADTGCGMSPEFQEHIYEPFAQENPGARMTYSGTGLGLSIVRQLVEENGGEIRFISRKGRGTTFTVTFYLREAAEPVEEKIPEIRKEDSISGVKILLVEDNELNMEIADTLLTEKGAVVTKAENGEKAVEIFSASEAGAFDVILMDIMMPVMDGLEACRKIRSLKRADAKKIPVFAMTANAFSDDVEETRKAGMNEHLSKPLDMEKVFSMIREYAHKK